MGQMTWRVDDELLRRVRLQAQQHGRSLNEWVTTVLAAASDPSYAGTDADRVRERLARAGLLETTTAPPAVRRPAPTARPAARAAAGRGTPLSDLVADGRR
jgi:plasmid stability protein